MVNSSQGGGSKDTWVLDDSPQRHSRFSADRSLAGGALPTGVHGSGYALNAANGGFSIGKGEKQNDRDLYRPLRTSPADEDINARHHQQQQQQQQD
ncbi:hypothetical protein VR010_04320 [Actinomycetaceae bacterium L2_0104]